MGDILTSWIDRILSKPIRYFFETPGRLLKEYVKPGMTVLDVGCGTGYYGLGMARLVGTQGHVVCVDTQREAVANLKQKADEANVSKRIEARVCSEKSLGVGDLAGRVDFAIAVYVVHHAADIGSLMSDVHAALKPGGRFLVIEPRHHASTDDCRATEAAARGAGFALAGYPRLKRDWAVVLARPDKSG